MRATQCQLRNVVIRRSQGSQSPESKLKVCTGAKTLILLSLIVLAACGGESQTSPTTTVPTTTAQPVVDAELLSPIIVRGYEIKPGADLRGADLSGADLSGLDLSGANLAGANLQGANLERADLSYAICLLQS